MHWFEEFLKNESNPLKILMCKLSKVFPYTEDTIIAKNSKMI